MVLLEGKHKYIDGCHSYAETIFESIHRYLTLSCGQSVINDTDADLASFQYGH